MRLVVVGVIKIRMAVQTTTVCLDELRVFKLLHVRGSLKHHVFEEMCEPGAALGLEPEADVVINGDRNDRRDVIFRDHNLQAVRKFVVDNRNIERFSLGVGDVGYQH